MSKIITDTSGNGVPKAQIGDDASLVVLNGGQEFVRKASAERLYIALKKLFDVVCALPASPVRSGR